MSRGANHYKKIRTTSQHDYEVRCLTKNGLVTYGVYQVGTNIKCSGVIGDRGQAEDRLNALRAKAKNPKKERRCMGCSTLFMSSGIGHRLCKACATRGYVCSKDW